MPKAGYERANLPELEVYHAGDVNDMSILVIGSSSAIITLFLISSPN